LCNCFLQHAFQNLKNLSTQYPAGAMGGPYTTPMGSRANNSGSSKAENQRKSRGLHGSHYDQKSFNSRHLHSIQLKTWTVEAVELVVTISNILYLI